MRRGRFVRTVSAVNLNEYARLTVMLFLLFYPWYLRGSRCWWVNVSPARREIGEKAVRK